MGRARNLGAARSLGVYTGAQRSTMNEQPPHGCYLIVLGCTPSTKLCRTQNAHADHHHHLDSNMSILTRMQLHATGPVASGNQSLHGGANSTRACMDTVSMSKCRTPWRPNKLLHESFPTRLNRCAQLKLTAGWMQFCACNTKQLSNRSQNEI